MMNPIQYALISNCALEAKSVLSFQHILPGFPFLVPFSPLLHAGENKHQSINQSLECYQRFKIHLQLSGRALLGCWAYVELFHILLAVVVEPLILPYASCP